MSGEKIALIPVHEPQILRYDENGNEIYREKDSEVDQFLQVWARCNCKKEILEQFLEEKSNKIEGIEMETEKSENEEKSETESQPSGLADPKDMMKIYKSAQTHMFWAQTAIRRTQVVLQNTNLIAPRGQESFQISHIGIDDPKARSKEEDVILGSRIIDKQLSLQSSSDLLLGSAKELREVVRRSHTYFRQLDSLRRRIHLQTKFDYNQHKKIICLQPSVAYPVSNTHITLVYNNENNNIKWGVSNHLRLGIDGLTYNPQTDNNYIDTTITVLQQNLFKHILTETAARPDQYATNSVSSKVIIPGATRDHELSLSVTSSDASKPAPLWLPWAVRASIAPNSKPLALLEAAFERRRAQLFIRRTLLTHFMGTDFIDIQRKQRRGAATYRIAGPYAGAALSVVVRGRRVFLSAPTHGRLSVAVDCGSAAAEHQILHWAEIAWWALFRESAAAVAATFGCHSEADGNTLTIRGPKAVVELSPTRLARELYVAVNKKPLLWSQVPGTNLRERLVYLLL